jgi:ssDNA-binding replication factor A large subunit
MEEMTPIEVLHGYTKEGMQGVEVHLGKLSSIKKLNKEDIGDLKDIKLDDSQPSIKRAEAARLDIVNLEENQFSEIRGTIVKINENKMYYQACPECRKKVTEIEDGQWQCSNPEHGNINPELSIFISLILDDGTACIRVTFFREQAEQLIGMSSDNLVDQIKNTDIQSVVLKLQKNLEGREIIIKGRPKRSNYDQELEINAFSFIDADPKAEIELIKNTLNV